MKRSAIIVFVKYPSPGKVKTRLAITTGENFAVSFSQLTTEQLINTLRKFSEFKKYIFYIGIDDPNLLRSWLGNEFIYIEQDGSNLGEKMQNAFNLVFKDGNDRILILGTDTPEINSQIIIEAFSSLERNDNVIGPSLDGGYYLLGMKKYTPQLFDKIDWSTPSVYSKTVNKMNELNLSFHKLETLIDIDTEDDLNKWLSRSESSCFSQDIKSLYKSTTNNLTK